MLVGVGPGSETAEYKAATGHNSIHIQPEEALTKFSLSELDAWLICCGHGRASWAIYFDTPVRIPG
jgi:hypothetical protein